MLADLLQEAKANRSKRAQQKIVENAQKEVVKLAKPLFSQMVSLTEKTIEAAEISYQRYDDFSVKFPFYPIFSRKGLAFLLLGAELRFLNDYWSIPGLDLGDRWSDHGPFVARKLAGLVSNSGPTVAIPALDENEIREAHEAFKALHVPLLEDIKPLLGNIEDFSIDAHKAAKQTRTAIESYKASGIPLGGNYAHVCACQGELLMRLVETWPGGLMFLKEQKRDYGLWCRGGLDKPVWPAYLKERYIQVRTGYRVEWLPVSELADFIKAQRQ